MRIAQVAPLWERVPPPGYGGIEPSRPAILTDELVRRGHTVTPPPVCFRRFRNPPGGFRIRGSPTPSPEPTRMPMTPALFTMPCSFIVSKDYGRPI